jgi:hypothetical protein
MNQNVVVVVMLMTGLATGCGDDSPTPDPEPLPGHVSVFDQAGYVVVEVWDRDVVIDDFIGQVEIPVEQLDSFDDGAGWRQVDHVGTLYAVMLSVY